jgi:membrane protease YdiL (CAAX protease family)
MRADTVSAMGIALPTYDVAARNPFLVILWSLGLFMLMHGHQYVGSLLIVWKKRRSFDDVMSGKYEDRGTLLLRGVVAIVAGLPLIWLSTTLLWRRPLDWMGLSFRLGRLLSGLALGLALPVIAVGLLCLLKRARVVRFRPSLTRRQAAAVTLQIGLFAVFAGISEEVVFRAMAARELSIAVGWFWAILISGAFFGLVHLAGQWKQLTASKAAGIMASSIAVGFMFIAMYVRSGSLWLPIGVHMAWNFSYSAILGARMNGEVPEASLFRTMPDESSWLAGGAAGMESSVPAVALYVLVGCLFLFV